MAEITAIYPTQELYMLKIFNTMALDSIDRTALEGPNRDLYGWVEPKSLRPY